MAEIYGSFGRVISGSSLSASVGNLSRQVMYDKIRRIFSAYRDEVTYDGALLDAATAIAKLNEILAMVDPNSEAASDIKSYIDSIRQTDRTRRADKAVNELTLQDASTKDYAKLIRSLQEITNDPTITDSEKTALQAAIANQVRNYIDNALKQYYEGGSITIDGKKVDLSLEGGADTLLNMIQSQITAFPGMANEIGKSYDIARSTVLVKQADIAFTSKTYKTDSEKKVAYEDRQKAYQKALDVLKGSSYDLSQSSEALNLMESIQQLGDNIQQLTDNIAQKYANDMVTKYDLKMSSPFDAVDAYGKSILGAQRDEFITTGTGLWDWVNTGVGSIDRIYDYFDRIAAQNGGKTTITWEGKTYDISHNGIKDMILNSARMANEADKFASSNSKVGAAYKKGFGQIADALGGFIKSSELFTIEDKYDSLYGQLGRDVGTAGGDIFAIRAAYERFAKNLNDLAGAYPDSIAADDLRAEANFYLGKGGDPATWYRVTSGNMGYDDAQTAGQLTTDIVFKTLSTPVSSLERYVDLNGNEVYGVKNIDKIATEFDPNGISRPEWAKAQDDVTVLSGIRIKDPLGGPTTVYQVANVVNSKGISTGFIGNINGKFFGVLKDGTSGFKFVDANALADAAKANGLSLDSFIGALESNNGKWRIILDWYKGDAFGGLPTVGDTISLADMKTKVWDKPVGDASGIGGLTPIEREQAIQDKIDSLGVTLNDFTYVGSAGRGEGQEMYDSKNLYVTIDGNTMLAELYLGKAAADYILAQWSARANGMPFDNLNGIPGDGSGLGPNGNFGFGGPGGGRGGFGTGFVPRGILPRKANDANAGIGNMSPEEAAYIAGPGTQRKPLTTGFTPAQTQKSLLDFRAGERAPLTPVKPVVSGVKPIAPVSPVGTGIKPIAPVSPIGVAGDSFAERMAQLRRTQAQSSTNRALSGFFRNSPFKIGL